METKQINKYCMEYKGVLYDVGTRVRYRSVYLDKVYMGLTTGVVISCADYNIVLREDNTGFTQVISKHGLERKISEILEPVYYVQSNNFTVPARNKPPSWDVEIAWVWYIVIMVVGVIFKDRLLIWVFATAVFFLWKNGYFNGGNK